MLRFLIAGIVGGALVFGAGAFNHMVLKLEGRQFDRLPEEAKFRDYFNKKGVPAGIYNFPSLPEGFDDLSKEEQEKEWVRVNELYKTGPAAFIVVAPGGDDMMGPPQLGGEFATNVLAALIAAFILCRTSPDSGYFLRLLIVLLLGLFTWLSTSASYALWYRFPWPYILDGLYCSLIEWGVAGIVMAAIASAGSRESAEILIRDLRCLRPWPSYNVFMNHLRTLGELKASGYRSVPIKDEMRRNLIRKLQAGEAIFDGILGYEETVLPQVQNAILSKHDMLFLGLRGQAKTRMLRQLTHLLDATIPIVAGSEVNDDPLHPLSRYAKELIAKHGDETPIDWITPEQRYHEKLATPDVTIADLIGEIDMIKHAEGRYLSSELTMHFGLIPRSNRGIFCMNELPDLSAKIQVGMFNVLEERDIQIRGYPIRLELDLCLVFSANPEDYTNRGRIVTPLKDRIGSVIRTHYPLTREIGIAITDANAWIDRSAAGGLADASAKPLAVLVPPFMKEILEETVRLARTSQAINQQSGVSVRMSIANMENMISNAERRGLTLKESPVVPRVSDLAYLAASTRGKIELTLSEDDGQEEKVLAKLLGEAIKNLFETQFDLKQFRGLVEWFEGGKTIVTGDKLPASAYVQKLNEIPVLKNAVMKFIERPDLQAIRKEAESGLIASVMEFVLEGLHVENRLNKTAKAGETAYRR